MHVSRSTVVNAPVEKLFNTLNDFNTWTSWSPWLIMDPNAKVDVRDDNKYYSWEGPRTGSGNMAITTEVENQSIDYDLTFLKPWKSTAKVKFELKPKDGSTEVRWLMDSSMPFFLFFMKKMMEAFIGMDYDRGLSMLKDYVEDGEVHSSLDFKGANTFGGCNYVGIKTDCSMSDLGPSMKGDFDKLWGYMGGHQEAIAGAPFSIYHKWDPVKGQVSYTSGVPVSSTPDGLPGDMITGSIPSTQVYTIGHTGPYLHLGNAWSTLYNMQRSKEFKVNKSIHPFETYENNPMEVPENELRTEVHFPIK